MSSGFHFYFDEGEENKVKVTALANAIDESFTSDTPLAVEVVFVDEVEIQRLNKEQRNIDSVTDVLSFPALDNIFQKPICRADFPYDIDEEGNLFLGSIVICEKRAGEQASAYNHSYERELHYLLLHGVLHCLGYDHIDENDRVVMRQKEEEILQKIGVTR